MNIPRSEYPRPQFRRDDWLCLNGEWQFEMDQADSGLDKGMLHRDLSNQILVPFCPESKLSGIEHTDFMNAVWYRRTVAIPTSWEGRKVLLHFQAVDYDTTVWVNGIEVGRHRGGFTPFSCDLQGVAAPGQTATIVVRARDSHQKPQARGKQSQKHGNYTCFYTRTTGIWQTVWMEPVHECSMLRPRITPDVAHSCFYLELPLRKSKKGLFLKVSLKDQEGVVCTARCDADRDFSPRLQLTIPENRRRLWSPRDPFLYDLEIELIQADGKTLDRVTSYAGLRSITINDRAVNINGETIFQRLVLDQGYYPDGIMTAPSDEDLKRDIEISMEAGFNGARLHQKVFEERFLYYADRMGYLVWGEFPDWGCGLYGTHEDHQKPDSSYIAQWLEALERDYSHPSIIGWCPLNETWQTLSDRTTVLDDVTRAMFLSTKAMDTTRPVLDASGYSHRVLETDIYDCHDYEQDPEKFKRKQAGLEYDKPFSNSSSCIPTSGAPQGALWSVAYRGQPFFVSEFGGIWWNPSTRPSESSWGYGQAPKTLEEFYERFKGLCAVLKNNPKMFGYCYTQLTDVYQEQNGLFTFDRKPKFDLAKIRDAQVSQAAIELVTMQAPSKAERPPAHYRETVERGSSSQPLLKA
jgi:beta-galactosidase/beta-glucuronidase